MNNSPLRRYYKAELKKIESKDNSRHPVYSVRDPTGWIMSVTPLIHELWELLPVDEYYTPRESVLDTWGSDQIAGLETLNEHQKVELGLQQDLFIKQKERKYGNS